MNRLIGTALAVGLTASLPAVVAAQDEQALVPEGVDWALTSYYDAAGVQTMTVPLGLEPTLRLEAGVASGFGGCNQFNGSYEIDGTSLRFGEEMSMTLALCDDAAQQVEDAYLAALGEVDGWSIDGSELELSDGLGEVVLTLEVPHILWTTSQVTELMTTLSELRTGVADLQLEVQTLRDDLESLNVPRLRERIRALEAENDKVNSRIDKLELAPKPDPTANPSQPTAFTSAERVLLKGIPTRIANYCSPLRSSLPKGTKAAVTCAPNTKVVEGVDYYLMEGQAAASTFGTTMTTFNVPQAVAADQTCEQGVKSQRQWLGNGWQSEGCYRTAGRAEVRFIDNATDCKKLKVDGRTMASPALYIALQGTNNDVARVHAWATTSRNDLTGQLTSLTQPIPSKLGTSTSCPT